MSRPQRRLHVLWIAAFAAFLHAMLPTLHGLLGHESWQAICSTSGQVTLVDTSDASSDATAAPLPTDSAHLKALQCPLCLAGTHLFDVSATQQPSFARPDLDFPLPVEQAVHALAHRRYGAFYSRGPPVSS